MSERLSRSEAGKLLEGEGPAPLRDLLDAASGPPRREELTGEEKALAAFVAARSVAPPATVGEAPDHAPDPTAPDLVATATTDPMTAPGRARRMPGRRSARVALAVALGLTTAGVATGTTLSLRPAPPPAPASVPAPADGSPGAAVRRSLCAARGADPSADPDASALASAAGGPDRVDAFCRGGGSGTGRAPAAPGLIDVPGVAELGAGSTGASPSRGTDTTTPTSTTPTSSPGRAVGPPGTSSGRTSETGRSVGPPATPPGRGRSSADG